MVCRAVGFMAEGRVLSAVDVCKMLALIRLEGGELVCHVWVRVEESFKVEVGNSRSLLLRTEFGVSATQFD